MNPGQNHHYSGSSLHMNGHPSHLKFQSAPKGPDWTTAMIPQCATNRGESYTSYVLTTISLAEPQHNEQRIPDEQRRRGLKSHPQNVQSRKVRSEAQMLSPSWRPSIRPSLCATGFCPAKSCFEPKSRLCQSSKRDPSNPASIFVSSDQRDFTWGRSGFIQSCGSRYTACRRSCDPIGKFITSCSDTSPRTSSVRCVVIINPQQSAHAQSTSGSQASGLHFGQTLGT